jgi:Tfp pilus assembly protein PilN
MRVILFNLFPYRADRERRQKHRVAIELAVGVLAGLLLCNAVGNEFADRVARKGQFLSNLAAMETEMAERVKVVQAKKDRVAVLTRQVNALKTVQSESLLASQWVSFLDSTVPPTVSMTRLYVVKGVLHVNGFTNAVSTLASWVDAMEAGNSLFQSVDLVTLIAPREDVATEAAPRHVFEIRAHLREASHESR